MTTNVKLLRMMLRFPSMFPCIDLDLCLRNSIRRWKLLPKRILLQSPPVSHNHGWRSSMLLLSGRMLSFIVKAVSLPAYFLLFLLFILYLACFLRLHGVLIYETKGLNHWVNNIWTGVTRRTLLFFQIFICAFPAEMLIANKGSMGHHYHFSSES